MERFRTMVTERQVADIGVAEGEEWGSDMADDDENDKAARIHTVVSGDTLWGIANRYETTIAEIRAANPSISGGLIHPGDVIRV